MIETHTMPVQDDPAPTSESMFQCFGVLNTVIAVIVVVILIER